MLAGGGDGHNTDHGGVTQGNLLYMVLYGITLVLLAEELRAEVSDLLAPFYADDATCDRPEDMRARMMKLLLERKTARVYLPEPAKSLFICD